MITRFEVEEPDPDDTEVKGETAFEEDCEGGKTEGRGETRGGDPGVNLCKTGCCDEISSAADTSSTSPAAEKPFDTVGRAARGAIGDDFRLERDGPLTLFESTFIGVTKALCTSSSSSSSSLSSMTSME